MFKKNREKLFAAMEDGLAIVPAAVVQKRNNDTEHEFRQNSDFQYLTGFPEPEAIALFHKKGRKCRFMLFVQALDPAMETWTGKRAGRRGAKSQYGADKAWNLDEFAEQLSELLLQSPVLYLPLGADFNGPAWPGQESVLRRVNELKARRKTACTLPECFRDLKDVMAKLRLTKSPAEIRKMDAAAQLTSQAFHEAMALAEPGLKEYQLKAQMNFVYSVGGGSWAFDTIVARGENACVLHYVTCRDALNKKELVVVDSGAEVDGYACDVTRTFPADGRFTPLQKKVYNCVLKAQRAAIAIAAPGTTIMKVHDTALEILVEGMIDLGIFKGKTASVLKKGSWRKYFPHGTSHWLGGDTHDVGAYADAEGSTVLEPGMVITVEPGLYFPPGDKKLPRGLGGIGIRIEDDILITENGNRNLTAAIPVTVSEVEKACRGSLKHVQRPAN